MSLEIKLLTLGVAATNCYLIGDSDTGAAVVVDPVDNGALLLQTAHSAGWQIQLMLATHGHYDHVLASHELKAATGAPFYIHQATPQAHHPTDPLIQQLFPPIPAPDRLLTDESEILEVGPLRFETLFTPGHAPDHVCYYLREYGLLFGGDCLFAGSIGRTDLPYGDYDTLMQSIFDQLILLGDAVQVLPGHMQPTTIGHERQTNPFLVDYAESRRSDH